MQERRSFSVSVFARHRDKILLIRHRRLGSWLPVGGEIEAGETPLEAARRELREEAGLEGSFELIGGVDGTPPGLLGYEEHLAGSKGLHMNFAFVAEVAHDRVAPNQEFGEWRWIDRPDELECPPNVAQLARAALCHGSSLEGLARAWLRFFNERKLDELLSLYADDAVHVSPKLRDRHPETKGEIRGKDALFAWWKDAFNRLPDLRYEERSIATGDAHVVLVYERVVTGEAPLLVAESYEVERGLIVRSRVFHG